jgi:hypothetical protein
MGCWWPKCNCVNQNNCGSICRTNGRSLLVENFDFSTDMVDFADSGTIGTPTFTYENEGTDLILRMQWSAENATWTSSGRSHPESRAWIMALDKHVYSVSDYGIPWIRRDHWRYGGDTDNSWIVNGEEYARDRYDFELLNLTPDADEEGPYYVGSPMVYGVIESNDQLYHCVGLLTEGNTNVLSGAAWSSALNGLKGRPWIRSGTNNIERQCLVTRRGYQGNSVGFFPAGYNNWPAGHRTFPGLPYGRLIYGAPNISYSQDLPQDIIDHGYRMGFVVSWQLGGQPLTPHTGSFNRTWADHTIEADIRVRIKSWYPDICNSTGSVNCFEPVAGFPSWCRIDIACEEEVRNAFKALTEEDCPHAPPVHDFPETPFACTLQLSAEPGVAGDDDAITPPTDAEKHSVTVSVSNDICQTDPLYIQSVSGPPPDTSRINGAQSYSGENMGVEAVYFRQVCEEGEETVGLSLIHISEPTRPCH